MRKVIAASAFAVLGVVTLSSCNKDYTCTCTYTYQGTTAVTENTLNGKKDDVKTVCANQGDTYTTCVIN